MAGDPPWLASIKKMFRSSKKDQLNRENSKQSNGRQTAADDFNLDYNRNNKRRSNQNRSISGSHNPSHRVKKYSSMSELRENRNPPKKNKSGKKLSIGAPGSFKGKGADPVTTPTAASFGAVDGHTNQPLRAGSSDTTKRNVSMSGIAHLSVPPKNLGIDLRLGSSGSKTRDGNSSSAEPSNSHFNGIDINFPTSNADFSLSSDLLDFGNHSKLLQENHIESDIDNHANDDGEEDDDDDEEYHSSLLNKMKFKRRSLSLAVLDLSASSLGFDKNKHSTQKKEAPQQKQQQTDKPSQKSSSDNLALPEIPDSFLFDSNDNDDFGGLANYYAKDKDLAGSVKTESQVTKTDSSELFPELSYILDAMTDEPKSQQLPVSANTTSVSDKNILATDAVSRNNTISSEKSNMAPKAPKQSNSHDSLQASLSQHQPSTTQDHNSTMTSTSLNSSSDTPKPKSSTTSLSNPASASQDDSSSKDSKTFKLLDSNTKPHTTKSTNVSSTIPSSPSSSDLASVLKAAASQEQSAQDHPPSPESPKNSASPTKNIQFKNEEKTNSTVDNTSPSSAPPSPSKPSASESSKSLLSPSNIDLPPSPQPDNLHSDETFDAENINTLESGKPHATLESSTEVSEPLSKSSKLIDSKSDLEKDETTTSKTATSLTAASETTIVDSISTEEKPLGKTGSSSKPDTQAESDKDKRPSSVTKEDDVLAEPSPAITKDSSPKVLSPLENPTSKDTLGDSTKEKTTDTKVEPKESVDLSDKQKPSNETVEKILEKDAEIDEINKDKDEVLSEKSVKKSVSATESEASPSIDSKPASAKTETVGSVEVENDPVDIETSQAKSTVEEQSLAADEPTKEKEPAVSTEAKDSVAISDAVSDKETSSKALKTKAVEEKEDKVKTEIEKDNNSKDNTSITTEIDTESKPETEAADTEDSLDDSKKPKEVKVKEKAKVEKEANIEKEDSEETANSDESKKESDSEPVAAKATSEDKVKETKKTKKAGKKQQDSKPLPKKETAAKDKDEISGEGLPASEASELSAQKETLARAVKSIPTDKKNLSTTKKTTPATKKDSKSLKDVSKDDKEPTTKGRKISITEKAEAAKSGKTLVKAVKDEKKTTPVKDLKNKKQQPKVVAKKEESSEEESSEEDSDEDSSEEESSDESESDSDSDSDEDSSEEESSSEDESEEETTYRDPMISKKHQLDPNFVQPELFLYTSFASGTHHMVSDTNRMAHILTANKVKYMGVDVGTDPKARKIWRWKAKGRQLPAIVREGEVMCDLKQLEDWCEYREVWDRLVEDDVF